MVCSVHVEYWLTTGIWNDRGGGGSEGERERGKERGSGGEEERERGVRRGRQVGKAREGERDAMERRVGERERRIWRIGRRDGGSDRERVEKGRGASE